MTDHSSKLCPYCNRELPIDSFGICRARADGHNLYCKPCINKKVAAQRINAREAKARHRTRIALAADARVAAEPVIAPPVKPQSHATLPPRLKLTNRVRDAIHQGARTFDEICAIAKRADATDCVCDSLLVLMDAKEIATAMQGEIRIYFPRKDQPRRRPSNPQRPKFENHASAFIRFNMPTVRAAKGVLL